MGFQKQIFSDVVRRSARLASRFRPGGAANGEAGNVSAVGLRVRSVARSVAASTSSGAPRRVVSGRVRDFAHDGARPIGCDLRIVRVQLERCDRFLAKGSRPAIFSQEGQTANIGYGVSSAIRDISSATGRANSVMSVTRAVSSGELTCPPQPQPRPQIVSKLDSRSRTADAHKSSIASTGIRMLQLNMRRSAVVTGEVRQLVAKKRLDVLLLQEPHVRKQGAGHTFVGLGVGMRVAAVRSQRPWAAVAVCNPQFQMVFVSQLSTTHCACVEVQAPGLSYYVVSCYFQYSDDIEGHLRHLETVLRTLRGERIIVAVDANARSSLWGSPETDERGAKFEDLVRACGMRVVNVAAQGPTFWTARGSSFIDVTLASPSMSQFIGDWKVRCDWTTSDHNSVDVRLRVPKVSGNDRGAASTRFDTRRADWERFAESLSDLSRSKLEVLALSSADDVEGMAETLAAVLTRACEESMPRRRCFRKSNPWWTAELTTLKKGVYRDRRAFQEERDEPTRLVLKLEYRSSLRRYSREVRRAKLASWREFVTSHGNAEPWGFVYKHQASKLRIERVLSTLRCGDCPTKTLRETAGYLLDVHVPEDRECNDTPEQREIRVSSRVPPSAADAPFFTVAEVAVAVRTFKNNKAPGSDLVEVAVMKAACKVIPGQLVKLYNGCLQWGVFPSVWKEGSLRVLLKDEGRDERDPKSYRPICLLSVVGKLFEKLLKSRLMDTSLAPGNVSGRQFGFMPGRSTEDAVVELRRVVSASEGRYAVALLFDISGAFDNVWWPLVLDSLKERDCPRNVFGVLRSYFDSRVVRISFGSVEVSRRAARGCPQGSVLGPACWNLMFDGLLRVLERELGNKFVAYADDLVVVVSGNSRRDIEINGQRAVDLIAKWCESAKLQISDRKTEAIVLRAEERSRNPIGRRGGARPDRKRRTNVKRVMDFENRPPNIRINGSNIGFKKTVRYLGVHFDKCLKVRSHCEYLNSKVGPLFQKLGRLARAHWGLRFRALTAICRGVFAPTVAYAAAGWADLCTVGDLGILKALQRRVLISMTGAYRTASWESLCIVAAATPVDIMLRESVARYQVRVGKDAKIGNVEVPLHADRKVAFEQIRDEAINMWQTKWTSSNKGRTTFAFFSDVRERLAARSLEANHWTTQVLTGHGNFRARLAALGLVEGDECLCGGGADTVQHFLLDCPLFEAQRMALRDIVPSGEWRWPNAARFFVTGSEIFATFAGFCSESLWLKGFQC